MCWRSFLQPRGVALGFGIAGSQNFPVLDFQHHRCGDGAVLHLEGMPATGEIVPDGLVDGRTDFERAGVEEGLDRSGLGSNEFW